MATFNITIKGNKIGDFCGRYFEHILENGLGIRANGWSVNIVPEKGIITCHSQREYSDGIHAVRKVFPLCDCTIGLSGGNVDERYAYQRTENFQQWLKTNGITAVKKENPNKMFRVRNAYHGRGEAEGTILTDGVLTEVEYDLGRTSGWQDEFPNTSAFEAETTYCVTGAKWALVKQRQHEEDCHNNSAILYTLEKDVTKLVIK